MRPAVEKACADRDLCVLIVPVAILAPHWNKLLAASALPRRALTALPGSATRPWSGSGAVPAELAVFPCDFGRLSPRGSLPSLSECPGAVARRQRPHCGSASDSHEQLRLR